MTELHEKLLHDGGWKSRKLTYAAGTSAAIVGLGVLAGGPLPGLAPILNTVVGGLIAVLSIYTGVNFAGQWNVSKLAQAPAPTK
jgi:hypothetical protein